jgi:hypothetical protein
LDSSASFELGEKSAKRVKASQAANPAPTRGHRGGVIPMHRALAHFRLGPMNLVTAIFLFLFFTSIWLVFLPKVCRVWNRVLNVGHSGLALAG